MGQVNIHLLPVWNPPPLSTKPGDLLRCRQVAGVSLHCGYPAVLLEDKLLDKVYSEMTVMRHSFFDSVQEARRHQRLVQQKAYLVPGKARVCLVMCLKMYTGLKMTGSADFIAN